MEKKKQPYLPHELIIQILLRLPVKSLICFKCVYFEALNLVLNYDPHPISLSIKFPLPRSDFLKIKDSCRGFILLFCGLEIFLWNPSTGFKTQIPLSPFISKVASKYHYYNPYGFGYDQSRDDYLVVVLYNDSTDEYIASSHLAFFSVRDNRWKEIEGAPLPYSSDQIKGLHFNGAIHWLALRHDFVIDVIVVIDLIDRKLFEIPLPDYFRQEVPMTSGLWVFGEFLILWTKDYRNGTIELWVMKEYKLNSSWTKTLVIPLVKFSNFDPICTTNNGDIIGTTACSKLVKYNNKGQFLEFRSFPNLPSDVVLYTESLLSLPGDNEQDYNLEE